MKTLLRVSVLVWAGIIAACGMAEDVSATRTQVEETNANMRKTLALMEEMNSNTAKVQKDSAAMREDTHNLHQNMSQFFPKMIELLGDTNKELHETKVNTSRGLDRVGTGLDSMSGKMDGMNGKLDGMKAPIVTMDRNLKGMREEVGEFGKLGKVLGLVGVLDKAESNLQANTKIVQDLENSEPYRVQAAGRIYYIVSDVVKSKSTIIDGELQKLNLQNAEDAKTWDKARKQEEEKKIRAKAETAFNTYIAGYLSSYILGNLEGSAKSADAKIKFNRKPFVAPPKGKKKYAEVALAQVLTLDPNLLNEWLKIGVPISFEVPVLQKRVQLNFDLPPMGRNTVMSMALYPPDGAIILNLFATRVITNMGVDRGTTLEFLRMAEEISISTLEIISRCDLRREELSSSDIQQFRNRLDMIARMHRLNPQRDPFYANKLKTSFDSFRRLTGNMAKGLDTTELAIVREIEGLYSEAIGRTVRPTASH
jgi:hypothetical protein